MQNMTWRAARRILGVPIFYKVIIANVAITGAVVSGLVGLHIHVLSSQALVVAGAGALILGSGIVNALLVRTALRPLDQLSQTARVVTAGDYSARVPHSVLADADLERLRTVYNTMLDAVENARIQQRELLAWMLDTTEKERNRIASSLNDQLAQRLTAAMFRASGGQASGETASGLRAEVLAVVRDLCDTAETLQPPGMRLLGLRGALDWYARSLEKRTGVITRSVVDGDVDRIDSTTALGLYRAIEDILDTFRLGQHDRVQIRVRLRETLVEAVVTIYHGQDNAAAFAPTPAEQFRIRERVACMGGDVAIESTEAQTAVRVDIPVTIGANDAGYDSSLAG